MQFIDDNFTFDSPRSRPEDNAADARLYAQAAVDLLEFVPALCSKPDATFSCPIGSWELIMKAGDLAYHQDQGNPGESHVPGTFEGILAFAQTDSERAMMILNIVAHVLGAAVQYLNNVEPAVRMMREPVEPWRPSCFDGTAAIFGLLAGDDTTT